MKNNTGLWIFVLIMGLLLIVLGEILSQVQVHFS